MRVGIIGAGQLGLMLGMAGKRLGINCAFLDPGPEPPASSAGPVLQFPFDSDEGLQELASEVDVISYEFENVPVEAIEKMSDTAKIYPPPEALRCAQDRLVEKKLFESLDIPVAAYARIDSEDNMRAAVDSIGLPLILKTRRLGYDGKGQVLVRKSSEVATAWSTLAGKPSIAEQWIECDREVSAIGARSVSGELAVYPITENRHRDGILRVSRAPDRSEIIAELARKYLTRLLDRLNYVGVLALEFFVRGDRLLANEFAPRVHNSGHWTIEGAVTSQFENHLRAILDMPLGDASAVAHVAMINLIGNMPVDFSGRDRCYLHDYGKSPRPGRKLGHITLLANDAVARDRELDEILEKLVA